MTTDVTHGSIDTVLTAVAQAATQLIGQMSAAQAILAYTPSSDGFLRVRCLDVSGTTVAHSGAVNTLTASATTGICDIVPLTATKAVALYDYSGTLWPIAVVLDLSGSTISGGAETTVFAETIGGGAFNGTPLTASTMLVCWRHSSTVRAMVLTGITGTTSTANTAYTVVASGVNPKVCAISATQALLVYNTASSLCATILDISGTVISFANPVATVDSGAALGDFIDIAMISATQAIVLYRKVATTALATCLLTFSGSTVTAGTPFSLPTLTAFQSQHSIAAIPGTTNVLIAYPDYNDSTKMKAVIVSALNTVLGNIHTVDATGTDGLASLGIISNAAALLTFASAGNNSSAVVLSFDPPTPPVTIVPISLPMQTLIAYGGARAVLTAPFGQLVATGHKTAQGPGMTAPMGVLAARGGGRFSASAPMGTLVASVSVPIVARAALTAPMGILAASATVGQMARAALTAPMGTVDARGGAVAALTAPMGTLLATSTVGIIARVVLRAPMGTLQASGTQQNRAVVVLTAPMLHPTPSARFAGTAPMGRLIASGHTVIAVTYEAYAVNLQPQAGFRESAVHEVTHYTGIEFDQIIRLRNRYYGVKADGVFPLGGDTDAGEPIAWAMHTGISNLGSRQMKACREAFVHGRVGSGLTAQASIGEAADRSYDGIVQAGETAQATRAKFGKGLKAVYWSFGLADPDGGPADIDAIQLDAAELTRKVF